MPIYVFECGSCGHSFDRLQRLSDADPVDCPDCGAAQLRRQLTAPQFRLAGAGWYETDFKGDSDKKRNLVDKVEAPSADSKAETKADSKPQAKPETKPAPKPETKSDAKPESKPAAPAASPGGSAAAG